MQAELMMEKKADAYKKHIAKATFPQKEYLVTNFGAVPGAKGKNTEAFKKAIEKCSKDGGGRVVVPKGLWLTGPITLRDNVNLHLEKDSIIKFSTDTEDYQMVEIEFEGLSCIRYQSPISGRNLTNIAITGEGIIDGSGDAWRLVKKMKLTSSQWKKLVASGGAVSEDGRIWWPSKEALKGKETVENLDKKKEAGEDVSIEEYRKAKEYLRPVLLSLVACRKILLDGPTFQNSPNWNLHPLMCEDIIIQNLTVRNPWYAQNGDGLDIDSCKNVIVRDCNFDVGDDAICLKSGKNKEGRQRKTPSEKIYISNCIVYHGHGGFVVGSEMSSGVKDVFVSNCIFIGTDIGVRFKSTRGRGGVVENIFIKDIKMLDIPNEAIKFNLFYEDDGKSRETIAITEETPSFQNIHLENIDCKDVKQVISIKGLPEMPIKNIYFKNVTASGNYGFASLFAENIYLSNVDINTAQSPEISVEKSKNVVIDGKVFTA